MWPCALTIRPLPYSTGFDKTAKGALRWGNGEKLDAIATITGATMPSMA